MSSVKDTIDAPSEREPLTPTGMQGYGQSCATHQRGIMCFNPKVVLALAAIALAAWAVAPGLAAAALPFLIVAACPLSMVLMMRGMRRTQRQADDSREGANHAESPTT